MHTAARLASPIALTIAVALVSPSARAEGDTKAAPPTSSLPAAPSGAQASARASPQTAPSVWVHLDGARDARLAQEGGGQWETVCDRPCDVSLSSGLSYRVIDRRGASSPFVLQGEEGQEVRLHAHRDAGWFVGWGLLGAGTVTAALGVSFALLSATSLDGSQCASCRVDTTALAIGLAGVPVALVGLAVLLSHRETVVSQRVSPAGADGPQTFEPPARTMLWARAPSVSLVSGTF